MTVNEALNIAKKVNKNFEFVSYAETEDNFYFCIGDPVWWVEVNKKTGETNTISRDNIFMEMIVTEGQTYSEEYVKKLEEALNNAKDL